MILGIGCDIVLVKRVKEWKKVFSEQELEDCRIAGQYDYASLAARFAAKEAFFKAFSSALIKLNLTSCEFSLLFSCKHVQVRKKIWDVPFLDVNWAEFEKKIETKLPPLGVEFSISHEKDFAVAYVVLTRLAVP